MENKQWADKLITDGRSADDLQVEDGWRDVCVWQETTWLKVKERHYWCRLFIYYQYPLVSVVLCAYS